MRFKITDPTEPTPNPNKPNNYSLTLTEQFNKNQCMDSISNLSLLEIAAEDDSLLSDAPAVAGTASSSAAAVFSCSPLLSFRSISRTALDSENASSVTKDGANNKENVSWNKPEVPKLNVEPQQMKRKKKGGSYNLRKSLAWDRAFLTEEGVLNPLELSMISGTATPKRANMELNSVQEEEPASASLALREIEENLFRQSSDGGVCVEDRRNIGAYGLSPKSGASTKCRTPASLAKRKVFAANDVVGNRSKRNVCPRPAASSSPDAAKAPSKESKVTKIPGPKPNISGIATTRSGTLSTGFPEGNQNARLATNVQKLAGARGLSKNLGTVPCNTKVDPAKKCSVTRTLNKQAGKRLDNSVSETPLPSGLHRPGTGASKVVETCLPQAVSNGGEKKQQGQSQSTKPSGLRMPSPSLGFFSQTKAPGSRNQLQKSSKPCKPAETNIPKVRKLELHSVNEARLPPAPRKGPEIVEGTTNICTKKLSLSDVKSEPSMEVDNTQITGLEVESDSLSFEEISKQETVHINKMAGVAVECDSLGLENISKQEMVENFIEHVDIKSKETNMEDMEFPRNEKKLLSKAHTNEQLEKEADHPLEDKICDVLSNGNQSVDQEPLSMHHQSMHRTLIEKGNASNIVHNDMGQDEEQIKLLTSDVLTSNESLVLQEKDGGSSKDNRQTEEFKEFNFVKTALVNSTISDFGETVLRGSIQGIPYKNIEQINDARNSLGDAQVRLLNGNFSVNCNDTTQSILEVVNQQVQGEQINTQNHSNVEEISSENENESQGNSCQLLHVTTLSSRRSPEKSMAEIGGACESEPEVAESEDCQHPVDEGYHQVTDSKVMHNRIQALELDKTIEDCIAVSATVGSTEVKNASPESRPFYENDIENLHLASQLCPVVKSDSDSRGNMLIDNHPTISEWQLKDDCSSMATAISCDEQQANTLSERLLRDDGSSMDTSLHFHVCCDIPGGNFEKQADKLSESQLRDDGTSMDTSSNFDVCCDVSGNFGQHDDASIYSETNKVICVDQGLVANHGLLLDESEFSEVAVDFISNTKNSICDGSEDPSCLLQVVLAPSVREFDHTNRESEEPHVEDEQVQPFVENPVVYNCNNENCLSVTDDQFLFISDNDRNEESHLSGLQGPSVGANSQQVDNIQHLDGDGLPENTAYSEFDHTNRESEETNVEDEQMQPFVENPVAYICNNERCLSVTNSQFLFVNDDDINEESHLSELQRASVVGANSQQVDDILHLDGDGLPAKTAYSEEIKNTNSYEGSLEGCNIHTSECNASNHHTQVMPEYIDGNLDVDERAECLPMDDVKKDSTHILPAVEVELNHEVISADFDYSIKTSEDSIAEVVNCKSDEHCSLSEHSKLPASDNLPFHSRIPQGSEVSPLKHKQISQEAETDIFEKDKLPNTEMQHQTKGDLCFSEDSCKITDLEKSVTESKPEVPSVKLPPNVVPFSDEWLAAIEAAGEGILTMKGGAVQNSPPEKPQQEPGPWSPVKRKNQAIGPFDCTKHTNIPHSDS